MMAALEKARASGIVTSAAGIDNNNTSSLAINAADSSATDSHSHVQNVQQQEESGPHARRSSPRHTANNLASSMVQGYADYGPPRMVKRDLPFHQSRNRLTPVRHNYGYDIFRLTFRDWFHQFLALPTWQSLTWLLAIWTATIVIFAWFYVRVDANKPRPLCGLGKPDEPPIDFGAAFAFSLQTCTTVGYTLPNGSNAFFENCPGLQTLIYFQMVWSTVFNAFLAAFFYTRVAKPGNRAVQVVFSKLAVVSIVEGQVRFQIRIFDLDAQKPVVEAHVRLYVIAAKRPVPRPLRVLQPNDEWGAMLFLSMPTVVSHHVDVYSLLHPPVEKLPLDPAGLVLRQADASTFSREEVICPICGEGYGTIERLVDHIKFYKSAEAACGFPAEDSHLSVDETGLATSYPQPIMDVKVLREYFAVELSEVICVVEGIDPLTSGTFQALQSYRFDEIVWDAEACFPPCLGHDGKVVRVDLDLFHEVDLLNSSAAASSASVMRPPRASRRQQSARNHDQFVLNQ